jgi:hypothetical protein
MWDSGRIGEGIQGNLGNVFLVRWVSAWWERLSCKTPQFRESNRILKLFSPEYYFKLNQCLYVCLISSFAQGVISMTIACSSLFPFIWGYQAIHPFERSLDQSISSGWLNQSLHQCFPQSITPSITQCLNRWITRMKAGTHNQPIMAVLLAFSISIWLGLLTQSIRSLRLTRFFKAFSITGLSISIAFLLGPRH